MIVAFFLPVGFVLLNPRYGGQVDAVQLVADGLTLILYFRQQKTRYTAVTGFSYLEPGNVVVPTAVEYALGSEVIVEFFCPWVS